MPKETSWYIMPYIRIYKIDNPKVCQIIEEKVEKAFQKSGLSDAEKYAIVEKIVTTSAFDNIFDIC